MVLTGRADTAAAEHAGVAVVRVERAAVRCKPELRLERWAQALQITMLNAFIRKVAGEITLHEWQAVIEKHPALAPQSDFYQFNPFTGETNWISGEGSANMSRTLKATGF